MEAVVSVGTFCISPGKGGGVGMGGVIKASGLGA